MAIVSSEAQWVVGIFLAVISYFIIRLVNQVDKIDKNVTQLMIDDGVKTQRLTGHDRDLRDHSARIKNVEKQISIIN